MNSDQQLHPECPEKAAATLQTAINKFNSGDYFTSHELLEALWMDETDLRRNLYKGILQIGIGLLHLQRNNVIGARSLLQSGGELIEPFTPTCFGIDLQKMLNDAHTVRVRLETPTDSHSFLTEDAIQILTV